MTGQATGHIGARIRTLRTAQDRTQTQLAAALGVRERTVARWEEGKIDPSTRYLIALCDELCCSLHWLMTGDPNGDPVEAAA